MRQVFQQKVSDKRVTLSNGTFQETGELDNWADIVVVAQVRVPISVTFG